MRYVILISLVLAQVSFAGECDIFAKVQSAGLYENAAFWDDFAKAGSPLDARLDKLIDRYRQSSTRDLPEAPAAKPQPIAHHSANVEFHKDAEKGFFKAPDYVQNRVNKLVSMANQDSSNALIQKLKTKAWGYHYIDQEGKFAVKLTDGYRALITVKDGKLTIHDVGLLIYPH